MAEAKNYDNGFKCGTCDTFHAFTTYVFSHMRDVLVHTCVYCGAKHEIQHGQATQTKPGVK